MRAPRRSAMDSWGLCCATSSRKAVDGTSIVDDGLERAVDVRVVPKVLNDFIEARREGNAEARIEH